MELQNKIAVVTGVSKGIGKQTVLALLDKGASVAGWGKTKPDYEHENFQWFETDVRSFDSLKNAFDKTLSAFGKRIDILINNSGLGYFKNLEDFSFEEWDQLFETNVNSIFYNAKLINPLMKQQKSGHIINISSIAGLQGMPMGAAYSGTKYAVRGMSDCMFKEMRDYGVKVSCVFPGSVQTDFFENAPGMDSHRYMMQPEEVAEQLIRLLETSDNFLINEITFRPLQPKGPKN